MKIKLIFLLLDVSVDFTFVRFKNCLGWAPKNKYTMGTNFVIIIFPHFDVHIQNVHVSFS